MKALLLAAPLLIGAAPQRIMSLMECNDLLLLALVPREHIASVTALAHEPAQALMPGADRGVRVNRGTAEDVVRDRPDLVLAAPFSASAAKRIATRSGARVVELTPAEDFAAIRANTLQAGALTGTDARARAFVAAMDAKLVWLAAHPPRRRWRVALWSGNGETPGPGTLADAVLRAAGGINVAASLPPGRYGSFDVEALIAARPDVIVAMEAGGAPSLEAMRGRHPVIRRLWRGRIVAAPSAAMSCGVPQSADAALALRRALERLR